MLNPQITQPYNSHATAILLNGKWIAVDVMMFETRISDANQFLIVLQPLIWFQNLMFTEISIQPLFESTEREVTIKSGEITPVQELNLFRDHKEKEMQEFRLKFRIE